jgi:hypothetical protein
MRVGTIAEGANASGYATFAIASRAVLSNSASLSL